MDQGSAVRAQHSREMTLFVLGKITFDELWQNSVGMYPGHQQETITPVSGVSGACS